MSDIEVIKQKIRKIVLSQLKEQNPPPQQQAPALPPTPPAPSMQGSAEQPDFENMGGDDSETPDVDVVSSDSMIKLFNAIRSGQSMKNDEVKSKLKEWWETNDKADLKKFLFMLANVAKVISEKDESGTEEPLPPPPDETLTTQDTASTTPPLPPPATTSSVQKMLNSKKSQSNSKVRSI